MPKSAEIPTYYNSQCHYAQSQGRRQEFGGGGVNALKVGGHPTVKTLKFEKVRGCMTLPSSYDGAAPTQSA